MARVILSIVFLIIFTVIIVMNLGNATAFNLFGFKFEELPTTAVAIVSFVLGVLYSFIYYLFSFFGRKRKEKIKKRGKQLEERESSLKERENTAEDIIRNQETSRDETEMTESEKTKSKGTGRGLFRKKK